MARAQGFDPIEPPEMERLVECIHCGLCLSFCPTYRELGVEADSPRGRLYLMRAVAEGRMPMTTGFVNHMYLCLNCRNCEYVCPSGVKFGHVMERTRAQIERNYPRPLIHRISRRIVFGEVFPHPRRLSLAFKMLGIYQRSGLQSLIRRVRILRYLPGHLDRMEEMLPRVPAHFFYPQDCEVVKPVGRKRFRVGFVAGCIMSTVYADVNRSTVRVLARNGCEVVTPRGQTCCAAIHTHNGERTFARKMARQNIEAFEKADVDYILINSAGCGAMLKEYKDLLKGDPEFGDRAKDFSGKVRDVQEFLAENLVNKNFGPIHRRATYQDPCHLAHVQRVRKQPRELIKMIPGLEFVEMNESDRCCGGAGTYAMTQYDLSMRILNTKMGNIKATGADLIIAPNPPCLMQLSLGVKRVGIRADVVHTMELLDRSYGLAERQLA